MDLEIQSRNLVARYLFLFLSIVLPSLSHSFEIIAHKGVHHEECLEDNIECRSMCLSWKQHSFIENTIPSINRAFELGAERVEIDLQMSAEGEVIVYHDIVLKCRTGINRFVRDLTVKELKQLDITKNLKFTNIEGNPMRGKGYGMLPTFKEVLNAFPGKGFLLNPKILNPVFLKRLNEILVEYTEIKKTHDIKKFSMWGAYEAWVSLKNQFPEFGDRFSHTSIGKTCEAAYESYGWSGYFPWQCKGFVLALTTMKMGNWNLWGGPLGIVQRFHENGEKIYLLHVENNDELRKYYTLQYDGVISSRLDILQ